MKKKLLFSVVFGSFVMLSSCEKKEPITCTLPNMTINASSPVISGDAIYLTTPNYSNVGTDAIFEWSGPNNFHSNLQNPVISNATTSNSGEYTLKVRKGICQTDEVKVGVEVINTTATCTQADDTANFIGLYPSSYSFYYNQAHAQGNEYVITAGGTQMDITATFSGDTQPVTGMYTVANKATALTAGKVHLKFNLTGLTNDYFAKSGDILVKHDIHGNVIVKFCSVPFSYSTNTTTDAIGSALFIQNQ